MALLFAARLRSEWRDHGEFDQQTHQVSWPRRPLSENSAERVARLMEEIGGSWSGWHGSRLRCQIPLFGERGQDKGAPHPQGLRRAIPHGSGGLHIKSIDAEYNFRFERVSVTHVFELDPAKARAGDVPFQLEVADPGLLIQHVLSESTTFCPRVCGCFKYSSWHSRQSMAPGRRV